MNKQLQQYKQALLSRYAEPANLNELAELVIADINRQLEKRDNRVVGFAWDLTYKNTVSNSHSCPISGVENFLGKKDQPTSYPGFQGRVWLRLAKYEHMCVSDLFRSTLTHTGSGGIGSYDGPWNDYYWAYYHSQWCAKQILPVFSWDYRFYISDWPLIEDLIMGQQLINVLNELPYSCKHKYTWTDPDTAVEDDLVISKYRMKIHALG